MKISLAITGIVLMLFQNCQSGVPSQSGSKPMNHQEWDALLHKNVDTDGNVNYRGFAKDSLKLNTYLDTLAAHPPDAEVWSADEQLTYWINAYNAFTVQLILKHYPLKSIKDIGSTIQVPFVNSPWDIKFIEIGDEKLDLNNIEHSILRKNFNEPRIHFAINCASISCPKLRAEAYTADKMERQLQEQTEAFINDPKRNKIGKDQVEISKIFSWFKGDFTKKGSLIDFVNKYSKVKIDENAEIDYLDYNWSLNEQ